MSDKMDSVDEPEEISSEDVRKFQDAESTFFIYLKKHQFSTRTEIISGLGWSPLKVDLFLEHGEKMGVVIPTPSPEGEIRYEFVDLFTVLKRRAEQVRFGAPIPLKTTGKPKDCLELLKEKGLL